jgi:quinol monooxygenase YgiN
MIHVIATIQVQPGRRAEFLDEFRKIVDTVRGEAGCLEYGPTVDVETGIAVQPKARPDVLTIVEKWADVDALEEHLSASHMLRYRERVKDLVAWVDLRILEPV